MRPLLIPEYFNEFKCIGSTCGDTCCAGWTVDIDKKTYKTYQKLNDPKMATTLKNCVKRNRKGNHDANYAFIKLDENNNCPLLLKNGLCSIHQQLGENHLSNICATYPRTTKKVGTIIEKSLTLSCPEAAKLVLLNESGIGFIESEESENIRTSITNEIDLQQNLNFWDIRIFTIQLLQNRQHSIEIRLIILGLFIQKIQLLSPLELQQQIHHITDDYLSRLNNDEYIASLQNIEGNLTFQINLAREVIRFRLSKGGASEKYLSILRQLLIGLELDETEEVNIENAVNKYKDTYKNIYLPFMNQHEYMLENYIVNHIFKNLFPYDYPTLFDSYVILIVHFSLLKIHLMGMAANQSQLTTEMVIECVQQFAKNIEHTSVFLQDLREEVESLGYSTMAHMFIMLKS